MGDDRIPGADDSGVDQPPTVAEPIPKLSTAKGPEQPRAPKARRAEKIATHGVARRFRKGTILAQRYRIVGRLGRGGMGQVYRAHDLTLDEPVALKLLLEHQEQKPDQRANFVSEARTARKVSHVNVCRVHDIGTTAGRFFVSMEFIDGENLASVSRRVGRLSSRRVIEIGIQVARGLAAIHAQGILHLDLKPSNLMLTADGGIKITDFGIATHAGQRAIGGTSRYMPPEQHDGKVSAASDLYALGLVLYELLTGQPAFLERSRRALRQLHRHTQPALPSVIVPEIDPSLEQLIVRCLEKEPAARPASAAAVARLLDRLRPAASTAPTIDHSDRGNDQAEPLPTEAFGALQATASGLVTWPRQPLPERPYPVLLPYTHPDLFAGRDRELTKLQRLVRMPIPILGLRALSGTGKSSLLQAGLIPALRAAGVPVAYDRHPWEPGLATRLVSDLVEARPDRDQQSASADLRAAADLAGHPAVIILDQFEEMLSRRSPAAMAELGRLIAESVGSGNSPPCRWLLAYRLEFHGEVVTWLEDILAEARQEQIEGLDDLPWRFAGSERFHTMSLPPLGSSPGSRDAVEEATTTFLATIEKPLILADEGGSPHYPWLFAAGHAERLAQSFARARRAQPDAPLVPELQVVLAHLLATAGPPDDRGIMTIEVPEDADSLIDEALDDHLRRALEEAFVLAGIDTSDDRSRALLALRELTKDARRRPTGLPMEELSRAIGPGGDAILQRLSAADTRLLVAVETIEGRSHWMLSHDSLAVAIVRLFDEDWRHRSLQLDSGLLGLRHFVTIESALHALRGSSTTHLPRGYYRQIEQNQDALLWDRPRRDWWAACRQQRRLDRRRTTWRGIAAAAVVSAIVAGVWSWTVERATQRTLLEQLRSGEPEAALVAFRDLWHQPDQEPRDLLDLLSQRERPSDLLERGLGAVPEAERSGFVLRLVELMLPLVAREPDDLVRLANLVWTLDHVAGRDPRDRARAAALRARVMTPLLRSRPAPPLPEIDDPQWITVPAGQFWMGSKPGRDPAPHEPQAVDVEISSFRMLDHEVTADEFRTFEFTHRGESDLPVAFVDWHQAYAYSAWLGGRLPTEAEWEYAARAGCRQAYCDSTGAAVAVEQVAWILKNSRLDGDEPKRQPPRGLAANPWGLFDMVGNLWEWTADWHAPYQKGPLTDPIGPIHSADNHRLVRGGCIRDQSDWARPSFRRSLPPEHYTINLGFRPVLPIAPP